MVRKQIIILDADGLVVKKPDKRFSERYARDFKVEVPMDKIRLFFENEFPLCLEGKADLKKVVAPHILEWNWPKSTDELLNYWFSGDSELDIRFKDAIIRLRKQGKLCYLATNNEKYRTEYLVRKLQLSELFDGIFSSCYLGAQKSKRVFFELVHEKLGRPAKTDVVFWDDDRDNINAATAFGYESHFYTDFTEFENWLKLNFKEFSSRQ